MPVYKDEQRGTFFCSFYYTDWTGEKKKKTKRGFKLKRDAQAYERSFLEQTRGEPTMTFASLVELYQEDSKRRLRESTYKTKHARIQARILPFFAKMPICQITPITVRKWQNELLEYDYKDTYLRTLHNLLSIIFNYAVRYYGLKENPCHKAGPIGKERAEGLNFWTREEYAKFIQTIEPNTIEHVGFQILYWSGIRIGELLALTPADFDFKSKTISITKSYQRIAKQDIITEPKTPKSNRVVMIPDFLCEEIKEYIERRYNIKPTDRLIPFTKSYFYPRLEKGCELAGIRKIRVHDIRHSHASLLIELGFSPLLIAERLGHEKVDTTLNTYSHLYPNKQAELVEKLENLE